VSAPRPLRSLPPPPLAAVAVASLVCPPVVHWAAADVLRWQEKLEQAERSQAPRTPHAVLVEAALVGCPQAWQDEVEELWKLVQRERQWRPACCRAVSAEHHSGCKNCVSDCMVCCTKRTEQLELVAEAIE
jgi:hypothetical protein